MRLTPTLLAISAINLLPFATSVHAKHLEETLVVADRLFVDTAVVSPSSTISAAELSAINLTTVEDTLAHEPSLIVRKRFIGDPNGVIGIRGSNMFQTTRSMVFADGMPLHFHLQTRFRGAPRWSLVSPSEIEQVEVIYGPYSSEYSGNAMGGVVNISTRKPDSEQIHIEAGYFLQQYDQLNTNDNYGGYRSFISYENSRNKLSYLVSYTRLDNDSQPQTQHIATPSSRTPPATVAGGAITGVNETGTNTTYFGDSGPEQATTNLFKLKLFYDFERVQLRSTIAYEDRTRTENQQNNYLHDANGTPVFDRVVNINGTAFDTFQFGRSRLQQRQQERDSLLLGLGASFELSNNWVGDAFYSYFQILDDIEIRSGNHPNAADFASDNADFKARLTEYNNTGWQIADLKFATDALAGNDKQRLSLGLHYDQYELNFIVDDYNAITRTRAADEIDGDRSTGRADSGGKANTLALFAQYGYQLGKHWDASLGLRYEAWESSDGFIGATQTTTRSEEKLSPKVSLAWHGHNQYELRYSIAQALRFPVIEELYVNLDQGGGASVISDPSLKPEDGIFHNLALSRELDKGNIRFNVFYEVVDDVIFNQQSSNGVRTFLPVGEVSTQGAELIIEQRNIAQLPLDIRYNLSYTNAEITDNVFNPSFVGKAFPRAPKWRSNILLNYRATETVSLGGSLRYASNSFGQLDNSDTASEVFGAQDRFIFVGAKINWQASERLKLAAGIDNIFDQQAYVFHPWPGRTFHINAAYHIGN